MKKLFLIIFSLSLFNFGQAQSIDTLVDVSGHKLHFNIVKGKGVPILFESGNGSDASDWKELLKPIHDSTGATLITYDRAGLGLSGIDTTKMDLLNEVKALETALKKLGYSKKYFSLITRSEVIIQFCLQSGTKEKLRGQFLLNQRCHVIIPKNAIRKATKL